MLSCQLAGDIEQTGRDSRADGGYIRTTQPAVETGVRYPHQGRTSTIVVRVGVSEGHSDVRTFLIADVRGYTRFTEEYGDEVAARLAAKFADVVRDGVEARGGEMVEIRGDEALAVFTSARQAIRAAVDLQAQFDEETEADSELPLRVGIGIDSGEAVVLEDGGYRGAALNTAARLCGRAHGGEVLISEGTSRLAGRLAGIRYLDRGRAHLKNISDPIHTFQVYPEQEPRTTNRWVLMFFGKPGRTLGWKLALAVVLIAAGTAAAVVYFTARGPAASEGAGNVMPSTTTHEGGSGGGITTGHSMTTETSNNMSPPEQLMAYANANNWACSDLEAIQPGARAALACRTEYRTYPIVFQMMLFRNGRTLRKAYKAELGHTNIKPDTGRCTANSWAGERQWFHGIGERGGRAFCHLDVADQRTYVTWTSEAGRRKILLLAQLNGLQHRHLFVWWRSVRHEIV
jgi:class 3 adenylate cyclase